MAETNMTAEEQQAWMEMAQDGTLRSYTGTYDRGLPTAYHSELRRRTLEVMKRDRK